MHSFPFRPEALSADWLTSVLHDSGHAAGSRVIGITHEPVGAGLMGDCIRFSLEYDHDGGGPSALVGKFAASDPTAKASGVWMGYYETEVRFYREIAATVSVDVPLCYFAEFNRDTGDFLILLEDMGPARGGDQLAGCSIGEAELAMVQAAALHAPRWNDPDLRQQTWLGLQHHIIDHVCEGFPAALDQFHGMYDDVLEPEYMAICDLLGQHIGKWLRLDRRPHTLKHTDFRLDNMLFDAKGGNRPLVVLDWQAVSVGSGALDIAYFLGAGISVTDRRMHEDKLLRLYFDELVLRGVKDYSFDELLTDYSINALQGVGSAIFAGYVTKRNERGDKLYLKMAQGACAQAVDRDTFEALARC